MKNLCETKDRVKPNFWQNILKIVPKENAFIEINNLFAAKPIKEIKPKEIEEISIKYNVNLRKRFLEKFKELYRQFLFLNISDHILTDQEVIIQNYLKKLLMLNETEAEEILGKIGSEIYRDKFIEVISNGKLEKSEEEYLDNLQNNLRLSSNDIEKIRNESRQKYMQDLLDKTTADGLISPEEWQELNNTAKNLDVTINLDSDTKAKIEKLKLYWHIEKGELPAVNVYINLQKEEKCYFTSKADLHETRTVTRRVNYGGPTARIKIMKGIYYSAGSLGVQRITSDQILQIDTGDIYLTNKRLIFIGSKKNFIIPYNKILSVNPYYDGISIDKGTGKSPIFKLSYNGDILSMILGRLLDDFLVTS